MPFAVRAGCRLYYDRIGGDAAAPLLVLVRGLARSSSYWGPLLPELAPLRLLVLDNRGVGRSDATRPPYTTRQLADDVACVMDAAGVARAHVFGMSLGGMIAQQLAIAHGSRVDRLVLGCTTPGGVLADPPPLRAKLVQAFAALGSRDRTVDRLMPLLVSDASVRDRPQIRADWERLHRDEPARWRGTLGQVAAALRHDAYDQLAAIRAPTLVITGDDDGIIPARNSRLLADRIAHARLVVLPGARHDFTTDRPVETGRAIVEFLTERPLAVSAS